jgi:hypothetical protein
MSKHRVIVYVRVLFMWHCGTSVLSQNRTYNIEPFRAGVTPPIKVNFVLLF